MGASTAFASSGPRAAEPAASRSSARAPSTPAARMLAMQQSVGNAAVGRMVARCCASCAAGGPCESELEEDGEPRRVARVLARYSHQDCTEDDLKQHIWPSDYVARQMVKKAMKALWVSPVDARVAALFPKYFMTTAPKISVILKVLNALDDEFAANDYRYECEDDCDDDWGYTWGGLTGSITQSHVHMCMNKLRDKNTACIASTIVHEMSHRYAGTDDNAYCNWCDERTCPSTLTADKALENADSYSAFVFDVWKIAL